MTMPDRDSKPATIKTILVLDDDFLVRKPVVQLLRECGYRVVEAASTDEAIAVLENSRSGGCGVERDRHSGVDERCWLRPMGSLNPPRIEDTACRNARAHGPKCS